MRTRTAARHVTATTLVDELAEGADRCVLSHAVARQNILDPPRPDERSYVQIHRRGPEQRFQIITERQEGSLTAIEAYLPFSENFVVSPDRRLAAIVDRVTFAVRIPETGSVRWRMRTSRTSRRRRS